MAIAALAWGFLAGPSLNPGYCWNETDHRSVSNQQERIKWNINTKVTSLPLNVRAFSNFIECEYHKYWLGGFVEGEGSLLVSIVTNSKVKHGVVLQPEFNVTQHESGLNILNSL